MDTVIDYVLGCVREPITMTGLLKTLIIETLKWGDTFVAPPGALDAGDLSLRIEKAQDFSPCHGGGRGFEFRLSRHYFNGLARARFPKSISTGRLSEILFVLPCLT